jgi:hypothetical protein
MRPVLLLLAATAALDAQPADVSRKWDATLGAGDGLMSVSFGLVVPRDVFLGHVRLGVGARLTFVNGDFELTPAGTRDRPVGVADSLFLSSSALMLNVSTHAGLVWDRLEAGMNIDLAGLGAGSEGSGDYRRAAGATPLSVKARPAPFGLLALGSNDVGSLNSEFFAAWRINDRHTLRAGLSHQLVEFRTRSVLTYGADRYRQYANLAFVGLRTTR